MKDWKMNIDIDLVEFDFRDYHRRYNLIYIQNSVQDHMGQHKMEPSLCHKQPLDENANLGFSESVQHKVTYEEIFLYLSWLYTRNRRNKWSSKRM